MSFDDVAEFTYLRHMTPLSQRRQPVGTRHDNEPAGGRWVSKTVPDIDNQQPGFDTDTFAIGAPRDWGTRTVHVEDSEVVFTRTVETSDEGNQVTVITSGCDDPALMLLARKDDSHYWNGDGWRKDHETCRTWCADIALTMLREGLVSTEPNPVRDGLSVVMSAASEQPTTVSDPHNALTTAVAQIRGLRLLQSMAPADGWVTKLGGYAMPHGISVLLRHRFDDIVHTYMSLHRPPWGDTSPPGVPWGPQLVAGHAATLYGESVFVGEHSDLMWRALTETTQRGRSPLKEGLRQKLNDRLVRDVNKREFRELVVAAALYDDTAAIQLTTGLFVGVSPSDRETVHSTVLGAFASQLPGEATQCQWTEQQQDQIQGFIDVVEGLEP